MTVLLNAVAFVILIVIGAIVVRLLCEEPDAEDGEETDEN